MKVKEVKNKAVKTVRNKRGQGMLEYVMLLAVVAVVVVSFRKQFSDAIIKLTGQVTEKASTAIGEN